MILAFVLTMPVAKSWNGKWSGADRLHVVTRHVPKAKAAAILATKNFRYEFGDGWIANVEAMAVDKREARRLRKQSDAFAGYEWMVESILARGAIVADHNLQNKLLDYSVR